MGYNNFIRSVLVTILFLSHFLAGQVDTLWERRWTSAGSLSDWAYAIAMDHQGFIYVTGTTENSGTNNDWTTIKYSPDGDTVWVRNFASSGAYNERASCIAVGPSGNVYLTGYTMSSGAGDYLTIKYRLNGDTAWTRRYNGTGNGYDFAHWIAVDEQENVYVTGYSRGASYQDDIATVKYDSSGNQIWVARFNGPGNYNDKGHKVIADNNGYVYVTGYVNPNTSGTLYDYVTIKYNATTGDTVWARYYNGPADSADIARDIAFDSQGNVYVTGSSRYPGTSSDIITIKYASNGTQQWIARYDNPDTSLADAGYGIKLDNAGNVYVAGQSQGLGTGSDIVLIKYNVDGAEQWVTRFDGPTSGYDTPSDEVGGKCMAMDSAANIYIGGTTRNITTYNDYVTIMYDSSGVLKWSAFYDGVDTIDYALAIAADNAGNVCITGRSLSPISYYDWATVKYHTDLSMINELRQVGLPFNFQVFPTVFTGSIYFSYRLDTTSKVRLNIYDITGRHIITLKDKIESTGTYSLSWDGTDKKGKRLHSGLYFCILEAGHQRVHKKIVLENFSKSFVH